MVEELRQILGFQPLGRLRKAFEIGEKIVSFFRRLATVTLLRPVKIDSYTCGERYFAS